MRPYLKTQPSTIKKLRDEISTKRTSVAIGVVSEKQGGIHNSALSAVLPRNVSQAYNIVKSQKPKKRMTLSAA